MESAIQLHPHDVRGEGADRVVENIIKKTGIRIIIPETATLEERHPYPRGTLPHNPRHNVVISRALLEVPLPDNYFSNLPFYPRLSNEAKNGNDYIGNLHSAAQKQGAEIIPWVKGLNASFQGELSDFCVQTIKGEVIPTWLCPSHSETREYVFSLLKVILEFYPSRAVLLDRMRYPDWSGDTVYPERMLTCFCPTCQKKMEDSGIELKLLKNGLQKILFLYRQDPERLLQLSNFSEEKKEINKWFRFRQQQITSLTEEVSKEMKEWSKISGSGKTFWLNLWPPSFAWFLGQDYKALAKVCDGAKHFPYHRLGGGADLAGLVHTLADEKVDLQEKFFTVIRDLLKLPYSISFQEFIKRGFTVDFVARETAQAKKAFQEKAIFSGIQIWDTPIDEIFKACKAAAKGGADGNFYYCYGWATFEALEVIKAIEQDIF